MRHLASTETDVLLLDLAQDAIIVRTIGDWRITFWDSAAERWQREEVLGRDLRLLDGGRQHAGAAGEWPDRL